MLWLFKHARNESSHIRPATKTVEQLSKDLLGYCSIAGDKSTAEATKLVQLVRVLIPEDRDGCLLNSDDYADC